MPGWRERTTRHLRDTHGFTPQDFADIKDHEGGDVSGAHLDIHAAANELRGTPLAAGNSYVPRSDHRHD